LTVSIACVASLKGPGSPIFQWRSEIESEVPTYSGGLGVLAGDVIRSSADLKIPLVAVTLISKKGYLKQKITFDGRQLEYPKEWTRARYRPNETISEEEKEKSQISTTSWNILLFLKSTRNGTVGYV
jgi:starch phosphorylase